jgi:hypothetical protein
MTGKKRKIFLAVCVLVTIAAVLALLPFLLSQIPMPPIVRGLILADDYHILFYGRVVDQAGQPVSKVPVHYQFSRHKYGLLAILGRVTLNAPNPRLTEHTILTDKNGYFRVSGLGHYVRIGWIGDSNYTWRSEESTLFTYDAYSAPPYTNAAVARQFVVWRKTPGYNLESLYPMPIYFSDFAGPGPHYLDLQTGRISTNRMDVFSLKVLARDLRTPLANVVISAPPDGRLYATNSLYTYLAPAAPYSEEVALPLPTNASTTASIFLKQADWCVGIYAQLYPLAVKFEIATNIPAALPSASME